jgi:multiple sugar transport system ATP-binding protein
MASVTLKGVRKTFGKTEVIKGVDLEVADGEFVVFVGPSGCGKSTLLRMIAGLEEISDGELTIGGVRCNDKTPKEREIAMVFQSYALYPHKTVYDNMAFGLQLAKAPKAEIDAKVREAARVLKMEELLDRKPSQLSGGQRQRVAIGRAIVRKPKVFLFDEPLSNLDASLRVNTRVEIAKLHRDLAATMIYVTHDQVEAMTLADKIVVLEAGEVRQIGSPMQLYHHPANVFVAGFIGSPKMNLLPGKIVAAGPGGIDVQLAGGAQFKVPVAVAGAAVGDAITLGVRPEHLTVAAGGPLAGKIDVVERLGPETLVNVALAGGGTVTASLPGDSPVKVSEAIAFTPDLAHLHVFDAKGKAMVRG